MQENKERLIQIWVCNLSLPERGIPLFREFATILTEKDLAKALIPIERDKNKSRKQVARFLRVSERFVQYWDNKRYK